MSVEDILEQRGKIYGDYAEVAGGAQAIKRVLRFGASYEHLTNKERESLDMIANKLARIVNGVQHRDSWVDVAGYAMLAAGDETESGE